MNQNAGEIQAAIGMYVQGKTDIKEFTDALRDQNEVTLRVAESTEKSNKAMGKASTETLNLAAALGATTYMVKQMEKAFQSLGDTIREVYTASALEAIDFREQGQRLTSIFSLADQQTQKLAFTLSENLARSLLISRREAVKLLASTTDLAVGLNMTDQSALKFASAIIQLGGDLASFQNIEEGVAFTTEKLFRGVTQRTMNLIDLKIIVRKTDIEFKKLTKTFENGMTPAFIDAEVAAKRIEERHKELFKTFFVSNKLSRKQAEAMALLFISYQQSQKAIGDMSRTFNKGANTIRDYNSAIADLKLSFGTAVLDTLKVTEAITMLAVGIRNVTKWWNSFSDKQKAAIVSTIAVIGVLALVIASILSLAAVLIAIIGGVVIFVGAVGAAAPVLAGIAVAAGVLAAGISFLAQVFFAWAVAVGEGDGIMERFGDTMKTLAGGLLGIAGFLVNLGENIKIFAKHWEHAMNALGYLTMATTAAITGDIGTWLKNMQAYRRELTKSDELKWKFDINGEFPSIANIAKLFESISNKGGSEELGVIRLELSPAALEGTVEAAKIIAESGIDPVNQEIADNTAKIVSIMDQAGQAAMDVNIRNMGLIDL